MRLEVFRLQGRVFKLKLPFCYRGGGRSTLACNGMDQRRGIRGSDKGAEASHAIGDMLRGDGTDLRMTVDRGMALCRMQPSANRPVKETG